MTGPQAERKRNVNAEHKRKTQNARHRRAFFHVLPAVLPCPSPYVSLLLGGEQVLSWLSGLPQRFCAAKALWDNFRAPAKIAWRVLWEEERQAYQVMRQTKRAADQTALPRRGGLFATCELWNAPLFGAFSDRSAGSTARDGVGRGRSPTEGLSTPLTRRPLPPPAPRSPVPTRVLPFPPALSRARSAIARPLTVLRLSPSLPPKKAKKRAGMLARSFSSQCLSCSRSRQEPWTCSKT